MYTYSYIYIYIYFPKQRALVGFSLVLFKAAKFVSPRLRRRRRYLGT